MEKTIPVCPYFGQCGGCTAQHIPYETQVANKKKLVLDHLRINGIAVLEDIPVFSDKPFHYRNRMDFAFCNDGLSLRKKGHFDQLVAVDHCPISNDRINTLMKEVNGWFNSNKSLLEPFRRRGHAGCLKYATIRASEFADSSTITFVLNEDSPQLGRHIDAIREFSTNTTALNVCIASVPKTLDTSTSPDAFAVKGSLGMRETLLGKTLSFSSQGFFQNNSTMADKMAHHCRSIIQERYAENQTKNSILIDLYGGGGTFGITSGDLFEKTIIIDNEGPNIEWAKHNLKANKLDGEAIAGDASLLGKLPLPSDKETFLVIDPPRSGMSPKVINHILALNPKAFLYVSCNPIQMARELRQFMKRYGLASAAAFDLFPQTPHVEAVVEMRRKG